MSSALSGLKQLADIVKPNTIRQLRKAGAMDPKGPIAIARTLPWLLGRGPSLGIVSQMHAFVLRDKIAVIDRNGQLTWKEVDQRANQVAHALSSCGLKGRDRVAMLLRNGREIAEVTLACQKLGLVATPMNTWAKSKELKATFEQADPKIIVYDTAHADQIKEAAPSGVPLLHVGDASKKVGDSLDYEDLISAQPVSPPAPFTRDRGSAQVIIHTSGTTGTPKGAARDSSAAGLGALANILTVVPYRRDDIVYCPSPIFHSFGLATLTFGTALGATFVLPEKFDPEESLRLIEQHRVTAASFVPVMIRRIVSLDDEVKKRYDLSSLRIVMASGSVLSEDLRRAATQLFGDVLYDLYGSTEIGWATIATPDDMRKHPKTVGKVVPGVEMAIFSEDGKRLGTDQTGELYVRSGVLFEGYTSGDKRDERDGFMAIGDLGRMDGDGYLFVESRSDDMVIVGGENIYPIEIERVIEDIDGVSEVAVLGVEDDEYGQVLAAFVVGSVDAATIEKTCKAELASYKVPKRIEILDELPRTGTGKVLKRELVDTVRGAEPLEED